MQAADRQGEQTRRDPLRTPALQRVESHHGHRRQRSAGDQRSENKRGVPLQAARNNECRHADVVHHADTGTDNRAANRSLPAPTPVAMTKPDVVATIAMSNEAAVVTGS